MEPKYAYQCVSPHLQHLRICGYYQLDQKTSKLYIFLHKIYMRIGLVWIIIYTLLQAVKMYEVQQDTDKVMGTLFLFLTHTDSIYKQIVFTLKAKEIEEVLNIMRGPNYNQGKTEHRRYLVATARFSNILLKMDNMAALITCFLWILQPTILHLQDKTVEFGIWVPFDYNSNPKFYVAMLYVWITTSSLAFGNTTMDVLISFLLAQCQTQLRILRYNLTNLIEGNSLQSVTSSNHYENGLKQRFKNILNHYAEISHFAQKIEDIFSGAIFYQFLVGGWIVCTSVYRIVDMDPTSVQFASMVGYIYCVLIQIFLYCHYGNAVTFESTKLIDAVYQMDWLKTPLSHRKHIIIFMERVKRPIEPRAGFIIPLSNNTFLKIIKSSYSFFTLLKAANE